MIHVKRLTQPPEPSWAVWDSAHPEAIVNTRMTPEEWARAAAGGPEAIRQDVRVLLVDAGLEVLAFVEQLDEL